MIRPIVLSVFLLFCFQAFAQQKRTAINIDSLKNILNSPQIEDTTRIDELFKITTHYLKTDLDSALVYAQKGVSLATPFSKSERLSNAYDILGKVYERQRDTENAYRSKKQNIAVLSHAKDDKKYTQTLHDLAKYYGSNMEIDSSIVYYNKTIQASKENKDSVTQAKSLSNIADFYKRMGNTAKAIESLEASTKICIDLDIKQCVAWNYRVQANFYENAKVVETYQKALDIYKKIKDTFQMARTLIVIGEIFTLDMDPDKGVAYLQEAIDLFKQINNTQGLSHSYSALAKYHNKRHNFEPSLEAAEKAIEYAKKINDKYAEALALNMVGSAYFLVTRYDEALPYFEKSKALYEKMKDLTFVSLNTNMIARVYKEKKDFPNAIKYSELALSYAKKKNDIGTIQNAAKALWTNYKIIGDYKKSLEMHELYSTLQDSINSGVLQKQLLTQDYKYEFDKQALADSLAFAQQQQITEATVENQRLGLIAGAFALLFLLALAYSIYKSRQRAEAEADRVKELDAFKSKFYTNITHEFRTPLTVILGMIRQIKENPKKNLDEGVTLIERNGNNLLNQINQILDLSKLETKSFNLNPVKDDLVSFVRYAAMSFQSAANSRNLSLRFFTPLEKLPTNFDPDAMQKIVQNLVSNAIKFTPSEGEVKVYLAQNGDTVEIKVQDTGVGINEAELPHIFDRFYQVENPADKTQEGTGIGLAYVQELVRVMNGRISVESRIGEGTEFLVTLPLTVDGTRYTVHEENTKQTSHPLPEPVLSSTATNLKPLPTGNREPDTVDRPQLLIIEDNPDVVAYLKNCLADQYQIDIAYNGRIGMEKAFESIPDLIITDVMMPEVGGYEVCDTLKNDERTSHIPIIMLTAKADMASKIAGLKRGADVYLSKPFDKEELLVRMNRMVERQQKLATYFSNSLHNGMVENITETIEVEAIEIEDVFIQKVKTIIEKHYSDEGFALPQLCSKIGMSRSQLFRKMKALVGESPSAFIRNYRLNKAKELLEKGAMNVSEVAWETGFSNLAHFSKIFQEKFGVQPSATNK